MPLPHGQLAVGDLLQPHVCVLCKLKDKTSTAVGVILVVDEATLDEPARFALVCADCAGTAPTLPLTCQRCDATGVKVLIPNGHDLQAGARGHVACAPCFDAFIGMNRS